MHGVVMDSLEEYLAGALEPAAQREVEAHLSTCNLCREEVQSFQDVSQLFGSLRSEEVFEPSPNFYVAVKQRIGERKAVPTFAGLFAMDFAFGRRIVFASLLTLAALGSYFVSSEIGYQGGPSPEAVMAQQDSPTFESAPAQDNMLVTLTAYEQH
jgi:anti-sigma factor RsiW